MSINTTVLAADLAAMIDDLPTVAKFGGTTFNCAATPLSQEQMLILTGNQDKRGVQICFPVSAISGESGFVVQARLQLKYPNPAAFTNYQIAAIEYSQDVVSYMVTLMQDNRS